MAPLDRADELRRRRLPRFLMVASGGLVALLAGLVWDVALHARDPHLAYRELVFSLANPAHVLFLLGLVAVVVGVSGAGIVALGEAGRRRGASAVKATVVVAAVAVVATAAAVARTASMAPDADESVTHSATAPAAPVEARGHGTATHTNGSSGCSPTPAQQAAADRLFVDTKASLARFHDVAVATAGGYRPVTPVSWSTVHYLNAAHAQDGRVLDPAHPEALVYANTTRGPVLAAAVYLMGNVGEPGPEIGGCLTKWHTHTNLCFSLQSLQVVSFAAADGKCVSGTQNYVPPEMMHVWVVDVPGGPFAHEVDGDALSLALRR